MRFLVVCAILPLASCELGSNQTLGGAAVSLGENCEGLRQLDYVVPVSQGDLKHIAALGYDDCVAYLIENDLIE